MLLTRPRLVAAAAALIAPLAFAGKPDVANGEAVFKAKCGICHAVSRDPGGPILGPNMVGLVGRKAGTEKDFQQYTPALKDYGAKWTSKTLDAFLTSPPTTVPGTTMPMMLPDDQERADVIAYLETLK